jgi:hypothetical protein
MPAANAETMSLHLTAIGRKVAADSHTALVLDGAGYHIAAALTIPENVTFVRLPPYAPELNPIENVWEYLRGSKLAITVFDAYDDIVDKATHGTSLNKIQTASRQSPPEHGQQSIIRAVGIRARARPISPIALSFSSFHRTFRSIHGWRSKLERSYARSDLLEKRRDLMRDWAASSPARRAPSNAARSTARPR